MITGPAFFLIDTQLDPWTFTTVLLVAAVALGILIGTFVRR